MKFNNQLVQNTDPAVTEGGGVPPVSTVAPAEPEQQTAMIPIGEAEFSAVSTKISRGKNSGTLMFVLALTAADLPKFAEAVGPENWHRTVMAKIIRPACSDASHEAIANGKFEVDKFVSVIKDWFSPAGRRSGGPTKSELEAMRAELTQELTPLASRLAAGEGTEDDKREIVRLVGEIEDLSSKIEKRTRTAKPKTA